VRPRLVGVLGLARSGRAAARLALSRGERVFASDAGTSAEIEAAAAEIRAPLSSVLPGAVAIWQYDRSPKPLRAIVAASAAFISERNAASSRSFSANPRAPTASALPGNSTSRPVLLAV